MTLVIKRTLIFFSCFALLNCATQENIKSPPVAGPALGNLFIFSETAPGSVPAQVRIYVNDDFMRIDDDNNSSDYVLFDRKNKIINNVVAETKTIFVINQNKLDIKPPIEIKYEHVKKESGAVTKQRGGMTAFFYKFSANGSECYNVVVIENYMSEALQAFKEFRLVLAGEHSKTMGRIPGQEYDACDLAFNIFESTRHLQYGFPVREWDNKGYQRFLIDVKSNVATPDDFLVLPEGYKSYSISQ